MSVNYNPLLEDLLQLMMITGIPLSKVAQTLGSPSAVGQLAVNQSPFYNWLKENSLNKGIL